MKLIVYGDDSNISAETIIDCRGITVVSTDGRQAMQIESPASGGFFVHAEPATKAVYHD